MRQAMMLRSGQVSSQARWSSLKAWTKFRTEPALTFRRRHKPIASFPGTPEQAAAHAEADAARGTAYEYLAAVHPSPCGNIAADGGSSARRSGCVSTTAGVGIAAGGLPDDTGRDVLSWRQPGSNVVLRNRSAGAPVRTSAWLEANDLDKLVRLFGHHASILTRSQH